MSKRYYVYVDEAGDEGFGKLKNWSGNGQSVWLALGAIIVHGDQESNLPAWRDEIMELFPDKKKRHLHFRDLTHSQKMASCSRVLEKPLGCCVVLSNKTTLLNLEKSKRDVFKKKGYLYNYLVRYLLERVSDTCKRHAQNHNIEDPRMFVTFSRRGGTDYQTMKEYLCFIRDGKEKISPVRTIAWDIFDPADIWVENHSKRAGLQVADLFTSATFWAFEPDAFGNCESKYSLMLRKRYIRKKGKILDHGVTLVPPLRDNPLGTQQMQYIRRLTEGR